MALGGQRWSVVTTASRQVRSGLWWALSECSLSLPLCISQLFPVLNSSWCSLLLLRSFPRTRLSPRTTTGGHVFVTACTSRQTPVFIVLCEGCAGGFPISTDLTLLWKCYFTFMWCTKSFGWVFRQTFLIIARCFWQSRSLSTDKHPRSALRAPGRVLGLSPKAMQWETHVSEKSVRVLPAARKIRQGKPSYTHLRYT